MASETVTIAAGANKLLLWYPDRQVYGVTEAGETVLETAEPDAATAAYNAITNW